MDSTLFFCVFLAACAGLVLLAFASATRSPSVMKQCRWFGSVLVGFIISLIIYHCYLKMKEPSTWAGQPWMNTTCTVVESGVPYKNTCSGWDGSRCMDVAQSHLALGTAAWHSLKQCSENTQSMHDALKHYEQDVDLDVDIEAADATSFHGQGRRLRICDDIAWPWVLVEVNHALTDGAVVKVLRCAHKFGYESSVNFGGVQNFHFENDWAKKYPSKTTVQCFILPGDDCPVALTNDWQGLGQELNNLLLILLLLGGSPVLVWLARTRETPERDNYLQMR